MSMLQTFFNFFVFPAASSCRLAYFSSILILSCWRKKTLKINHSLNIACIDQVSSLETCSCSQKPLSTHNKCFLLHLILGKFFQEHENRKNVYHYKTPITHKINNSFEQVQTLDPKNVFAMIVVERILFQTSDKENKPWIIYTVNYYYFYQNIKGHTSFSAISFSSSLSLSCLLESSFADCSNNSSCSLAFSSW